MCLDYIIEKYDPPLREKWAWGLFFKKPLRSCCFGSLTPKGKWLTATKKRIGELKYRSGFHKYCTRKDARASGYISDVILKVKLRHIRILGQQCRQKILVADEMLVPRTYKLAQLRKEPKKNKG